MYRTRIAVVLRRMNLRRQEAGIISGVEDLYSGRASYSGAPSPIKSDRSSPLLKMYAEDGELEQLPHWVRNPMDLEIMKASSLEELTKIPKKYELSPAVASSYLSRLCKLWMPGSDEAKQLIESDAVSRPIDTIVAAVDKVPIGTVVFVLRTLLFLGVSPADPRVTKIEERVTKDIHRIGFNSLFSFTIFHQNYSDKLTATGKGLQESCQTILLSKIGTELSSPDDLIMLMTKFPQLMPRKAGEPSASPVSFDESLERKSWEIVAKMNSNDVARTIVCMGNLGQRNISLLLTCVERLKCQPNDRIPMKTLLPMIEAVMKLAFFDEYLYKRIAIELNQQIESIKRAPEIGSLMNYFGTMRLRDEALMGKLMSLMESSMTDDLTAGICISILISCSKINYQPPQSFTDMLLAKIDMNNLKGSPRKYLNVIHSLAVLGQLNETDAADFLQNSETIQKLVDPSDLGNSVGQHEMTNLNVTKILNIQAAYEIDLFQTPVTQMNPSTFGKEAKDLLKLYTKKGKIGGHLRKLLRSILPESAIYDVITSDGYHINAMWEENSKKRAIVLWDWGDYTLKDKELKGNNSMTVRHLIGRNFDVSQIENAELRSFPTLEEQMDYIKGILRLSQAVGPF